MANTTGEGGDASKKWLLLAQSERECELGTEPPNRTWIPAFAGMTIRGIVLGPPLNKPCRISMVLTQPVAQ